MSETCETLDLIQKRRSIRKFSAELVTEDQIRTLVEAAQAAPSAMNQQPWRCHFITSPKVIQEINSAAFAKFRADGSQGVIDRLAARGSTDDVFYGAPLVVIITAERSQMAGYGMLDCGIVAQTIALAAEAIGLGSCIIGLTAAAFSGLARTSIGHLIQMPDSHEFAISIAIGHPLTTKEPHERQPERIAIIN